MCRVHGEARIFRFVALRNGDVRGNPRPSGRGGTGGEPFHEWGRTSAGHLRLLPKGAPVAPVLSRFWCYIRVLIGCFPPLLVLYQSCVEMPFGSLLGVFGYRKPQTPYKSYIYNHVYRFRFINIFSVISYFQLFVKDDLRSLNYISL